MSEWNGLHNHDRHHPGVDRAWNLDGGEWCYPHDPCHDCMVAEHGDPWEIIKRLEARADAAEAQVRRVREFIERNTTSGFRTHVVYAVDILAVLDGGDA